MNEKTVISPPRGEFMDLDKFYMFSLGDNTEQLSGRLFNSVEVGMLPHYEQPLWMIYPSCHNSSF